MGSTGVERNSNFNPISLLPRNTSGANTTSVKSLVSRFEDLQRGQNLLTGLEGKNEIASENMYYPTGMVKQKINQFEEAITKCKGSPQRALQKQRSMDFSASPNFPKKSFYDQKFFDDMSMLDSSLNSSMSQINDFEGKRHIFDNPLISGNKLDCNISYKSKTSEYKEERSKN